MPDLSRRLYFLVPAQLTGPQFSHPSRASLALPEVIQGRPAGIAGLIGELTLSLEIIMQTDSLNPYPYYSQPHQLSFLPDLKPASMPHL